MFTDVLTDTGSHYNAANASFTVPYNGLYAMSLVIHTDYESSGLNMHMYRGNERISGAIAFESRDMASNMVLVELNEGDVIWINCESDGILFSGGGNQNNFSGFIVSLST